MTDPELNDFPFLTRKMLDFEHGTAFDLEVNVTSPGSLGTLKITGATKAGPFSFEVEPTGGIAETFTLNVPDVPIFTTAHVSSNVVTYGDMWVSVYLRANQVRILKMYAGYVTTLNALAWPYPATVGETKDRPAFAVLGTNAPAAGAEATITVPAGEMWRVHSVTMSLVTSSTVANRRVHLTMGGGAGVRRLRMFGAQDQAASLTYNYFFQGVPNVADEFDNNVVQVAIPTGVMLYAGNVIQTVTTNIQAGDDFGTVTAWGELFRVAL